MRICRVFVAVLVVAAILGTATFAGATCAIQGKIVYMQRASGGATVVYLAPATSLPLFYFVYTTVDPNFITMLSAAQASGTKVSITGSAAACPTSGTTRAGGVISVVYVLSNL
jgi:hypothetical protein